MNYQVGHIGRVVVARFEDRDDVIEGLGKIVQNEGIRAASFYLIGGMRDARIVAGPEKDEIPPTPVWRELGESHEIVGFGTIFYQGDTPRVHFHGDLSIICIDLLSFGGVFLSSIHQTENNLSGHYP